MTDEPRGDQPDEDDKPSQVADVLYDVLSAFDYDRLDDDDYEADAVRRAVQRINEVGALRLHYEVEDNSIRVSAEAEALLAGATLALHVVIQEWVESTPGMDEHDAIARARARLRRDES